MNVKDLQSMRGFWLQDSQEVEPINEALGLDVPAYFMLEPEDGVSSGQYQVYACYTYTPWLESAVEGPFDYPL